MLLHQHETKQYDGKHGPKQNHPADLHENLGFRYGMESYPSQSNTVIPTMEDTLSSAAGSSAGNKIMYRSFSR
jgi:hypothetical protein